MRHALALGSLSIVALALVACKSDPPPTATTVTSAASPSVYDLSVKTLDGKDQPLSIYKGKVALVVNTASECGYTPQYAGLEKLYESYADKPFVILGFPSNDFGAQEPGSDHDIATFTTKEYGIKFPLFSKSDVKGPSTSPVFDLLTKSKGEPKWNFHKYLLDKQGKPLAAWPSKVTPDDPALKTEIDRALAGS